MYRSQGDQVLIRRQRNVWIHLMTNGGNDTSDRSRHSIMDTSVRPRTRSCQCLDLCPTRVRLRAAWIVVFTPVCVGPWERSQWRETNKSFHGSFNQVANTPITNGANNQRRRRTNGAGEHTYFTHLPPQCPPALSLLLPFLHPYTLLLSRHHPYSPSTPSRFSYSPAQRRLVP